METLTTKTTQTYVIWTETGREEHLVEFLGNTVLKRDTVADTKIYVPKKKKLMRGPKGWTEVEDILFPSYVFLDTADIMTVYDQLTSAPSIKTFYRMLGTGGDKIITVTATEKLWIDHILGDERIAGVSRGIKEGKTITFIQGPLVGLEAFVELLYTGYTPAMT